MKRIISFACALAFMLTLHIFSPQVYAAKKLTADDFVHADGRQVIGTDSKPLEIRGMALGNSVWGNPSSPNYSHHNEQTYKELSEMGFNCVRFYLNYGLFESDSSPYNYRKTGFAWIDKNIKWAKKYNMGIILNMHYPQGGYQSQGNGLDLWSDKSNRKRLTNLWAAIAKRYRNEPTIWGYGLVNEPIAPLIKDKDNSFELYDSLIKSMVKAVRKKSPYQAIFIEPLGAVRDPETKNTDYSAFTSPEEAYSIPEDDNIIYEFHCYAPHTFTHQGADWAGNGGIYKSYPSQEIASANYTKGWAGCKSASRRSSSGGWDYVESEPVTLTKDYNIACMAINGGRCGSGSFYYDDITVTEISPNGTKTVIRSYDFEDNTGGFYPWSEDGSGELTHSDKGRSGKCVEISGAYSDFTASADRFELKKGYKYIVSGYVYSQSDSGMPFVRLDFAQADGIRTIGRDYLEDSVKKYVDFSEKHNVPLYLGEFGVINAGFEENRGGAQWVSDIIDICRRYNIGFNYHTYHETNFGLYKSSDNVKPAAKDRNNELMKLFREKLTQKGG